MVSKKSKYYAQSIEEIFRQKYPNKLNDRGISKYEREQLLDEIQKKIDDGFPSSAMILAKDFLSKYGLDAYAIDCLSETLILLYRFDEAVSVLNKGFKVLPKSKWHLIYHSLGKSYEKSGNLTEAENYYKKALESHSKSAMHHLFLGCFYGKRGDFEKAENYFEAAINTSDGSSSIEEAYYNLGYIQTAQGKYSEALSSLNKALDIDPDYEMASQAKEDLEFVLKWKS